MPGTKGGLMEAIEKVKAKGMKEGGNVPKPKMRPKSLKADKTVIINEDFSKRVAKANEEAMKKAKKMKEGGDVDKEFPEPKERTAEFRIEMIPKEFRKSFREKFMSGRGETSRKIEEKAKGGPIRRRKTPKPMRAMNKLDDAVEEFIETIEPFQGTVRKGEKLRNIDGKTMIIRQMPNPNFSGNTISDRDRAMVGAMLGEGGKMISDADRQMVSQMMGARKMEDGGVVPAKFKGFSKLPEDVQQKMNPTLAKKFKKGGPVKMGSGGGVCRGMGAARAGGKFKLR